MTNNLITQDFLHLFLFSPQKTKKQSKKISPLTLSNKAPCPTAYQSLQLWGIGF